MGTRMLEHRGIVQRVDKGQAIVVMETAGCASCGQGSSCGVGKMAAGRPATLLTVPVGDDVRPGETVLISLAASHLGISAVLGYFFPAFAMLFGAGIGAAFADSDSATALGAIVGFLVALVIARLLILLMPDLAPAPRLIPFVPQTNTYPQEQHHD